MNLNTYTREETFQTKSLTHSFMASVFSWMFLAMAITALVSFVAAGSQSFLEIMYNMETGKMSIAGWIIMLSPLGLVFWMSAGFAKMNSGTLTLIFIGYSALMGLSLSFIFLSYSGATIAKTFVITSAMFGLMAVLGYTTKTDLTRFGSLMMMGLVGVIIATLVNFFMKSSTMEYIISFVGVLVFTGLTAYDVQKIKRIGMENSDPAMIKKATIMGALTLYLDFINLFLFLLRFFGNRK